MEEYIDMLQSLLERPILNVDFNYCYIPVQIAAFKCFLMVRDWQERNTTGAFTNLLFFLVTISWVLPNILRYSVWNALVDFGVMLSYSYVRAQLFLHKRTAFLVYDISAFIGCLLCSEIEVAVDFYLILSLLYNYLFVAEFQGNELTAKLIISTSILFFSMWCFYYFGSIWFFLRLFLEEGMLNFTPRVFFYSLITIPTTLEFTGQFCRRVLVTQQGMNLFPNISNWTRDWDLLVTKGRF